MESPATLLVNLSKTNMLKAKNSLPKAWGNHEPTKDFSETVVETFDKIPEPLNYSLIIP